MDSVSIGCNNPSTMETLTDEAKPPLPTRNLSRLVSNLLKIEARRKEKQKQQQQQHNQPDTERSSPQPHPHTSCYDDQTPRFKGRLPSEVQLYELTAEFRALKASEDDSRSRESREVQEQVSSGTLFSRTLSPRDEEFRALAPAQLVVQDGWSRETRESSPSAQTLLSTTRNLPCRFTSRWPTEEDFRDPFVSLLTLFRQHLQPLVSGMKPELASKVTEMMLELDGSEQIGLLLCPAALDDKVEKAVSWLWTQMTTGPLLVDMLRLWSPQQQKQILGERLYPSIKALEPGLAGKITGMLLDIDNMQLLQLLLNPHLLKYKVQMAVSQLWTSMITGPLCVDMLKKWSPEQQKKILGERLYLSIQKLHPTLGGKITGMLLELDNTELLQLLQEPPLLKDKVQEAVDVLEDSLIHHDLNRDILHLFPMPAQKEILGEHLYTFIQRLHPVLAPKITGMLLELDNSELLHLLTDPDLLEDKVHMALDVLQNHQQAAQSAGVQVQDSIITEAQTSNKEEMEVSTKEESIVEAVQGMQGSLQEDSNQLGPDNNMPAVVERGKGEISLALPKEGDTNVTVTSGDEQRQKNETEESVTTERLSPTQSRQLPWQGMTTHLHPLCGAPIQYGSQWVLVPHLVAQGVSAGNPAYVLGWVPGLPGPAAVVDPGLQRQVPGSLREPADLTSSPEEDEDSTRSEITTKDVQCWQTDNISGTLIPALPVLGSSDTEDNDHVHLKPNANATDNEGDDRGDISSEQQKDDGDSANLDDGDVKALLPEGAATNNNATKEKQEAGDSLLHPIQERSSGSTQANFSNDRGSSLPASAVATDDIENITEQPRDEADDDSDDEHSSHEDDFLRKSSGLPETKSGDDIGMTIVDNHATESGQAKAGGSDDGKHRYQKDEGESRSASDGVFSMSDSDVANDENTFTIEEGEEMSLKREGDMNDSRHQLDLRMCVGHVAPGAAVMNTAFLLQREKLMMKARLHEEVSRMYPTMADQIMEQLCTQDNSHIMAMLESQELLTDEVMKACGKVQHDQTS